MIQNNSNTLQETKKSETKKTNRKNNTNLSVKWMEGHFTIKQLWGNNPDFKEITLRSHLNKAIESKKVAKIGFMQNPKGRPELVLSTLPITREIIDNARKSGVVFNEEYDKYSVMEVNSSNESSIMTNPLMDTSTVSVA